MNKAYLNIERKFEQLTEFATKILGNSISFLVAFCLPKNAWPCIDFGIGILAKDNKVGAKSMALISWSSVVPAFKNGALMIKGIRKPLWCNSLLT